MKATILIVGEDQVLCQTRALLLAEWEVSTTHPVHAAQALRDRACNLLIICQSVSDTMAQHILAEAVSRYPKIRCLAICNLDGPGRPFSVTTYSVRLDDPGGLRDAVAILMRPDLDRTG